MTVEKKKYIIELPENTHWIQWIMEGTKDHHPYMDYKQVEDLMPYAAPDLEQVRKEAYKEGREAGIKDGMCDAWEVARKVADMPSEERRKIFGENFIQKIQSIYSASEAIEKIRQYERKKEKQDGLRQNIQTIVDQCGYTLDEIAAVLKEMREE